jgi:hypothetical protein
MIRRLGIPAKSTNQTRYRRMAGRLIKSVEDDPETHFSRRVLRGKPQKELARLDALKELRGLHERELRGMHNTKKHIKEV